MNITQIHMFLLTFLLVLLITFIFVFQVFAWFFLSDHGIYCTCNYVLSKLEFYQIIFCSYKGTCLDIKKIIVLLRTSVKTIQVPENFYIRV